MMAQTLQENELHEMLILIFSNDGKNEQNATTRFRKWMFRGHLHITTVIESGTVSKFIEFMKADRNLALRIDSAWVLTHITSGTSEQKQAVIEAGVVPAFVKLLNSEHKSLQELAVQGLDNIMIDYHPEYQDLVLSYEVVEPLLQMLSQGSDVSKHAVQMLKNLCRSKSRLNFEKASNSLPALSNLLLHTDKTIVSDACWTICFLLQGHIDSIQGLQHIDKIQRVIDAGVCDQLVKLLMHNSEKVAHAALSAVGNVVRGNDNQTQLILDLSVLPKLLRLANNPKTSFKSDCCWVISNITAGTQTQIQEVIDAKIVPTLIHLLGASDFSTKNEAAWALKNICDGGSVDQIKFIIKCGCIAPLCNLLTIREPKILTVVLDSLVNILYYGEKEAKIKGEENPYATMIEECSGYEKILSLAYHEYHDVYSRADYIIATHKFPT